MRGCLSLPCLGETRARKPPHSIGLNLLHTSTLSAGQERLLVSGRLQKTINSPLIEAEGIVSPSDLFGTATLPFPAQRSTAFSNKKLIKDSLLLSIAGWIDSPSSQTVPEKSMRSFAELLGTGHVFVAAPTARCCSLDLLTTEFRSGIETVI